MNRKIQEYLDENRDSSLEEDVYWAYMMLPLIEHDEDRIDELRDQAPGNSLYFVRMYFEKQARFDAFLKEAFKIRKQKKGFRDDGRGRFEVFDQAYSYYFEKFVAERKCPFCQRQINKKTVLLPRPKRSGQ